MRLNLTTIVVITCSVITSPKLKAEQLTKLEDIVITSQRREELLQNVPITINSFNKEFIRITGSQTLADIDNYSPALEVDGASITQPIFKMRGIGTTDFGIGTDPSVSIYQDDVYIGRSGNALLQFTDIERVEVLKGPQGTLFGRNSAAGAIQIITQKPSNEISGWLRARFGNYDKKLVEGVANTPIIKDQLLLRVNALYNSRDGIVDNADGGDDFSDEGYQAARASLLWYANDTTQLRYTFDFNHVNQQGPTAIGLNSILSPNQGDVTKAISNDAVNAKEKRTLHAHTLNLQHDFSMASMTWISSYRQFNTKNREDEDGVGKRYAYLDSENSESNQQFSQEIRFNGNTDHFDWVGGLIYAYEKGEQTLNVSTYTNAFNAAVQNSLPFAPIANVPLPDDLIWTEAIQNKLTSQSMAAFADITWSVTQQLKLTFGVRHTRDKKRFSWKNLSNNLFPNIPDQIFQSPAYPLASKNQWLNSSKSWNDTSPRAVVSYQWNKQLMSFFSYSQGYKAGGFNSQQQQSSFEPETVENFEGGIKSSWFDQRLLLNASIFHYQYDNKQDISFEQQGTGPGRFVTRTGNAEANGGEFELRWLPIDNLQLGINYGYLDANWTKRVVSIINYNTATSQLTDLAGHPLMTPKHHALATLDYNYSLKDYGSLAFHLDHSLTSKRQFTPADADYYFNYHNRDSAHHYTNQRLSWSDREKHYQVAV
ncbi:MAG: TonB-dependent receptor plug domain-containing protein [Methylomarinum sp.]|nr:TonB-dependent receptor plug domain-containing protein [Methylomarinum sp.]